MESGSQGWDETNSFESNLTSLTRSAANSAAIPSSDDKPDASAAACMVSEDVSPPGEDVRRPVCISAGACIHVPGNPGNRGDRKAWSSCPTIGRFGISLWKKVRYQVQWKLEIEESTKVYLIGSMAYNRWVSFQMNQMNPHPTSVL